MPLSHRANSDNIQSIRKISAAHRKLLSFGIVILAVYLGDGLMSYAAPVLIEQRFGNPLTMGFIMSTSSVFGLIFDIVAGRSFSHYSYCAFVKWLLLLAIAFPLIFLLLPHEVFFFVLAMGIWGVYYELTKFSLFSFVSKNMHRSEHALSWGFFEVMHAVGFVIGPILASLLLEKDSVYALAAASMFYFFAVLCYKFFYLVQGKKRAITLPNKATTHPQQVETKQIHVWELLSHRLWPLLLFTLSIVLIDTAFFSIGTLLSEELKEKSFIGLLLLPAYTTPFLFMPWFAHYFSTWYGKKRTAFAAGIFGGLILSLGSLTYQVELLMCSVFITGMCLALAYPEINATFEDYVVRIGKAGNSLVGLQSSMYSLAYIIGPIVAGYVSTKWGNQHTLALFGGLLTIVSVLALVVTPRKVRMPQQELSNTF